MHLEVVPVFLVPGRSVVAGNELLWVLALILSALFSPLSSHQLLADVNGEVACFATLGKARVAVFAVVLDYGMVKCPGCRAEYGKQSRWKQHTAMVLVLRNQHMVHYICCQ
jgi:hypothetical protein